jgi:hypothetical protein
MGGKRYLYISNKSKMTLKSTYNIQLWLQCHGLKISGIDAHIVKFKCPSELCHSLGKYTFIQVTMWVINVFPYLSTMWETPWMPTARTDNRSSRNVCSSLSKAYSIHLPRGCSCPCKGFLEKGMQPKLEMRILPGSLSPLWGEKHVSLQLSSDTCQIGHQREGCKRSMQEGYKTSPVCICCCEYQQWVHLLTINNSTLHVKWCWAGTCQFS